MKALVLSIGFLLSTNAMALSLECKNNGEKINVTIDESASSLVVAGDNSAPIQFEIYRTVDNQVSAGEVRTYSVKNGKDASGFELSGEVGTLSKKGKVKKVAMSILNDSLGSTVLRNRTDDLQRALVFYGTTKGLGL